MFKGNELIVAIKSLATVENSPAGLSHCQRLDYHAERYGFSNFHHCRKVLTRDRGADAFMQKLSVQLMRAVCASRTPVRKDCAYCEFIADPEGEVWFYSSWIGWAADGEEIRVPRRLDGTMSVPRLRRMSPVPVYLIESDIELSAWLSQWRGTAYMREDLARRWFPERFDRHHLIAEPPPSADLIRAKYAARAGELDRNVSR